MKKVLLMVAMLFIAAPDMHAKGDEEEVKVVLVKEENSDNYYYEGVVPVDGVSKEEMFKRAKEWILSNFKTGDNNAQFDEGNMQMYNTPTITVKASPTDKDDFVNFKIKLLFKDGKYKFRFDNLIVKSNYFVTPMLPPVAYNNQKMFKGTGGRYNRELIASINYAFAQMAIGLEKNIKNGGAQKDDW